MIPPWTPTGMSKGGRGAICKHPEFLLACPPDGGNLAMAYIIAEPCVGVKDKACVEVCPVDCIKGTDADTQLFINPEECIDCGACEPVCPVEAIFEEAATPDKWKNFIQINADWYKAKKG